MRERPAAETPPSAPPLSMAAPTAVMRRPLAILNAIVGDRTPWRIA